MKLIAEPAHRILGEISVPGDKSISHRAVMLGAIAEGTTEIHNFLASEDCLHTISVLQQLGVTIKQEGKLTRVFGKGIWGLQAPAENKALDFGNAGTGIRLMSGLLAGQHFSCVLHGDQHLNNRPMNRIIAPLLEMGANIRGEVRGHEQYPPLEIIGQSSGQAPGLTGIDYKLPIASAQVKSCLLLAGLYASEPTSLFTNKITRDHTERLLQYMGGEGSCQFKNNFAENTNQVLLTPSRLQARELIIPNDISSAAFFMVGAAMTPGSHIMLKNVGINPTRCGILKILQKMGADIQLLNQSSDYEPTADIEVRGTKLVGVEVPIEWVAEAIDEFPILFIAASAAKGRSVFRGLAELKVKESNRIGAMAKGLINLGVKLELLEDGLIIEGRGDSHKCLSGGIIDSFCDHRIAMSFVMASLLADEPIEIQDSEYIATSFPNFMGLAHSVGLKVSEENFT